ncbi:MAG: hypothetical protein HYR94_13025, partial [Chloroflexi bacterium]|nr:hypothetical protein [Chloroflexota bacterium]
NFTTADGLADNSVWVITQDSEGALWFNTRGGGVSRYQYGQWQSFTTDDGLVDNHVQVIAQDRAGALWFGTWGGGVSHYQGGRWQSFTTADGLADNHVQVITQDSEGALWFGTWGGLSRYRRGTIPPGIWLMSVNGQSYEKDGSLNLSPDIDHLTAAFEGGDTATRTEDLVYVHRLVGASEAWTPTHQQFAVYRNLSPGRYIFQVKALDEDGNFSEPAEVEIIVPPPPPTPTPVVQQVPGPTQIVPGPTQIIPGPTQIIEVEPTVTLFGRSLSQTKLYGYGLAGLTVLVIATVGLTRWQAQRHTRQAIARKENPYIANVPVKDPKMFFGREDILRQIINGIHHNNFAVCGPKRIGKTSLLHQVEAALPKLDDTPYALRPVMLSLHGVAEANFFQTLARAIARQSRVNFDTLPGLGGGSRQNYDVYDFLADVETVCDALQPASAKPVRLVLLVDEGDALNEYSQPTLAELRYAFMGSGLEFLKTVWTGEALDQRPWTLPGSDWRTIFGHVFNLTTLSEAEAIRLIQEPVPYYRYDKDGIRLILDESQLIPHRIQLLCRAAVEEMLKEGRGRIKLAHAQAASRALTSQPYRVAPGTGAEATEPLAESGAKYHPDPDSEEAE